MKNAIRISVKKPCTEKFENFSKTPAGGFCGSCQKEVIDFTTMTSKELLKHFNNTKEVTCGRFKPSQLKTHGSIMNTKTNTSFASRGIAVMGFSLLSLCGVSNMQAQEVAGNDKTTPTELNILGEAVVMGKIAIEKYTVSGTVIDEENLPLAGVNVVLKGSTEGIVTDLDGKFKFPRALDVDDTLIFSYIGYNPQEYSVLADASKNTDIKITFDLNGV